MREVAAQVVQAKVNGRIASADWVRSPGCWQGVGALRYRSMIR